MADETRRPTRTSWLAGRSDRREYWAYIGILFAMALALAVLLPEMSNAGTTGVLLIIQVRRFHDLGRSGWWVLALLAAQLVAMAPMVLSMSDLGFIAAAVLNLAIIAVMGAIPGQPHENRFGPPRGKRRLKEIFS